MSSVSNLSVNERRSLKGTVILPRHVLVQMFHAGITGYSGNVYSAGWMLVMVHVSCVNFAQG